MDKDWKTIKIQDLGTIITGKTPSTKVEKFWGDDLLFITPKDLQISKHIQSTERSITEQGLQSVKNAFLPKQSICVSCIGNLGYVGMTTRDSISNQQINSIVVNEHNDPDFVYYLMKFLNPVFKNLEGQSTALSILNKTQFSQIDVRVTTLKKQKAIAQFLSYFDAKIELNSQINKNLYV